MSWNPSVTSSTSGHLHPPAQREDHPHNQEITSTMANVPEEATLPTIAGIPVVEGITQHPAPCLPKANIYVSSSELTHLYDIQHLWLGAVPKTNGKWRVIMYLSVPEGISINSFIDTFLYSTVDDVVALREDAIRPRSTSRLLSSYCPFLQRSGIYLDSTGGRDIVWMFAYILWPPLSLKHLYLVGFSPLLDHGQQLWNRPDPILR
ncbi:hypothetical protein EMCRGX_G007439 [Ephydatia muelleri]